ncbi:hypothetical protein [Aequorivita flava]|uniref:Methyltransferase domain-containing protein n=1 Tax=Aequorivita flava TaxID=3114371 RepID=A0AB35YWN6_9FLAO
MVNINNFSNSQYRKFCTLEGSEYIASEFALRNILRVIKKNRIEKVLEIGVGIGTISGSIIKFSQDENLNISVTGTEANEFCLKQIPINLKDLILQLKLYPDLSKIPDSELFDIIIVDGSEKNLNKVQCLIKPNGIILIEGDRSDQVKIIKKIFKSSKFVHLISLTKNGDYSVKNSDNYQGGLKIIYTDPSNAHLIYWFSSKIKTKIKYILRKL